MTKALRSYELAARIAPLRLLGATPRCGSHLPGPRPYLLVTYRSASTRPAPRRKPENQDAADVSRVDPYDEVSPPRSSLPPPLNFPARSKDDSAPVYWFRVGRAYGSFYWAGLKAAWANHKECAPLKKKLREFAPERTKDKSTPELALVLLNYRLLPEASTILKLPANNMRFEQPVDFDIFNMSRARYQKLMREERDWSKLPVMGILVALCGEYLPLLVPFFPNLVPRTCRIPKQIVGMRKDSEKRRREGFKRYAAKYGRPVTENGKAIVHVDDSEQLSAHYKKINELLKDDATKIRYANIAVARKLEVSNSEAFLPLLPTQLLHRFSWTLGLHGRTWDRLSITPPRWMMGRRLQERIKYLMVDDLLLQESRQGIDGLSDEEVRIACEERGIDVTDRPREDLLVDLQTWLNLVMFNGNYYHFAMAIMALWEPQIWNESRNEITGKGRAGPGAKKVTSGRKS
ncbi:LETM1-like protein 2 [Elsinoe australis]|uniref:LETM1-like protein 2 n=1 Tax=Elsinoe australis TaxID=40998 RepID=A0A4U7B0X1_9PEZI|nr:LETM1-like protein 2 [Elsinoe australis]